VPSLRLSDKTDVQILVYRTKASGSVFFLDKIAANVPTADTVSVTLTQADVTLETAKQLYTTGGVLDNIAAPATRHLAVRGDRLFCAIDTGKIVASKLRVAGEALEMTDTITVDIPEKCGKVSNLTEQDGRLIAFCSRGIFYVDGDGPSDTGIGDFSEPRDIVSPVGAIDGPEIVTTSAGTFFVSARGIELLGRDYAVRFVGDKVEDFLTPKNVTAFVDAKFTSEIRVCNSSQSEKMLVYNYFFDRWSRSDFLLGTPTFGTFWNGGDKMAFGLSDDIITENTLFTDIVSDDIETKIITPWIKISGTPEGYARLYRFALLGTFKAAHTLNVKTYYDYDGTVVVDDFTKVFAADPKPQQLRFKPKKQKAQAIKFEIFDSAPAGTEQGFFLNHLELQVGVKGGIVRLGSDKSLP
jgi:hypothetical protein